MSQDQSVGKGNNDVDIQSLIGPLSVSNFKTLLFLGAGASAPFGFPLANHLLGNIYRRLKKRNFDRLGAKDTEFLARALETLTPFLRTSLELENDIPLPTVLGMLNHMLVAGTRIRFQNTSRTVADVKALLEYAIADELTPDPHDGKNHKLLNRFANILLEDRNFTIGVISTNYDVCVEQVIFDRYSERIRAFKKQDKWKTAKDNHRLIGQLFDFGTSWRLVYDGGQVITRPMKPKFAWYKLHGSLNWLRCDQCEHVYINPDWPIATLSIEKKSYATTCHCGYYPLSHLLVTPSLVRDIRETNLLQIWRHALELLRTAKKWIFVGYSLPAEDIAIRSILQRAYYGRGPGKHKPHVFVVDFSKDGKENGNLKRRYRELFPNAKFTWGGVEELIEHPKLLQPNQNSDLSIGRHSS